MSTFGPTIREYYNTGLELFEGVQAYIEYYHSKKHQGTRSTPNDAYSKFKKLSAA